MLVLTAKTTNKPAKNCKIKKWRRAYPRLPPNMTDEVTATLDALAFCWTCKDYQVNNNIHSKDLRRGRLSTCGDSTKKKTPKKWRKWNKRQRSSP
jgi:hypothetical protein